MPCAYRLFHPGLNWAFRHPTEVAMVAVDWPVSENLPVWKPESDRGESRLGYQTSGLPKGSPFVLPEARAFGLEAIGVSAKSLRGFAICVRPPWSRDVPPDSAYGHRVNCPGEKPVSTSQILTEARTTC